MNKLDLIKEAEEKLIAENLEKDKKKVFEELRFIGVGTEISAAEVRRCKQRLEKAEVEHKKQIDASEKYKETGDFAEYQKAVGIDEESRKSQRQDVIDWLDSQSDRLILGKSLLRPNWK